MNSLKLYNAYVARVFTNLNLFFTIINTGKMMSKTNIMSELHFRIVYIKVKNEGGVGVAPSARWSGLRT